MPFGASSKRALSVTRALKPLYNKKVAEREGIEPTKPLTGFNGFENRGDHQARSTLRLESGLEMGLGQTNEWKN